LILQLVEAFPRAVEHRRLPCEPLPPLDGDGRSFAAMKVERLGEGAGSEPEAKGPKRPRKSAAA
jgi:hypothetical protein